MHIPAIMQLSSHLGCHGTGVMKKTSEREKVKSEIEACVVVVFLRRILDDENTDSFHYVRRKKK